MPLRRTLDRATPPKKRAFCIIMEIIKLAQKLLILFLSIRVVLPSFKMLFPDSYLMFFTIMSWCLLSIFD